MLAAVDETTDLAGARLSGSMRRAFIPEINDQLTEAAAQWAETNNATIELAFSDEWREVADWAARTARGADVVELFGNGAHLLSDRLVDVSDFAGELSDRHGGWSTAAESAGVVDGVWRAIPWAYTAHAINSRTDLLDAAGATPPATYDELLDAATLLADNDLPRAGFSMGVQGPNDSSSLGYSMLWSFGGQEVDAGTGKVALDSAGTRAALDYWRELARVSHPAAQGFDEAANNEAFIDGEIALTQNASSIFWKARIEAPQIAEAMGHLAYPAGPAGRHQLVEMNLLGVLQHTPNPAAAKSWLGFATNAELMRARAVTSIGFYSPPLADFEDDPAMPWNAEARFAGLRASGPAGHLPGWPGPSNIEAGLAYDNRSIVKMFAAVADGSATTDEAVRIASEELKRVYET